MKCLDVVRHDYIEKEEGYMYYSSRFSDPPPCPHTQPPTSLSPPSFSFPFLFLPFYSSFSSSVLSLVLIPIH